MAAFWTWVSGTGMPTVFGASITFVFGLIALAMGAIFNSYLNRRRDDRLRREEMKSVSAALYGEILLLRDEVAQLANIVAKTYFAEGFSNRSTLKFDETLVERNTLADAVLYPSLASKLGLLAPEIVLAITKFHADYRTVRTWLPMLVQNEGRPFTYSVLSLLEPAREAVLGIKPTLRLIEQQLDITVSAKDPEFKDALTAIDREIEFFADANPSS